MSSNEYALLYNSMTAIEARETLLFIQALDYQNGKKDDRNRFRKEISRLAYPANVGENDKTVSAEEIVRMFGNG